MAISALMNVMITAARKAAKGLIRDFGEVENLQVSLKGPANFVSAADQKCEKILFEELSRARPQYGFLMEESGEVPGADKTQRWIIDPVDGTTNFLHSVPLFAISIALEREGQLAAALTYNPIMNELYTAERGKGAFLNDRRLRVSARTGLADAVIATGLPNRGRPNHPRTIREIESMAKEVAGLRRTGAASLDLAWTAAGRFDGYWEHDIKPWDMAAGILLVREAGGFATDATGGQAMMETGSVVVGPGAVQKALLATLAAANRSA
jgi:myo-inositol-1(or 4)-monophosphatase